MVFALYSCRILKVLSKRVKENESDLNYLGDFNIWVDNIRNYVAQKFLRLLNSFSLVNLVNKLTYNSGHTLDSVITKSHHSLVKSLTVDTINNLSDLRNVNFHLNFNYAKVERKFIRYRKKNSSFPDNLREKLDEKFPITQNDCHHTEIYPCVNCVTSKLKLLTRDVYGKCCPSIEKNILIKSKCNK